MLPLTEKPEAVEIPKKKEVYKCILPPPNPCTKTGKLLRLLEASHREDRRRLHEDDERGEEDVGDRRRDASVRDVVPKADAVRDALRVVVALVDEAPDD